MATKQKKPMAKTIIKAAVIIGVLIIPLMYSYFYLSAFWDPYSRLQDVSVAVVNLDKGAKINGKDRNVGKEICDHLEEDGSLDFHFVSEADAKDGLMNDKYYAEVLIPADLTDSISTASKNTKKQHAQIQYVANQKRNYLASQILESGMMPTIKETVNGAVNKEITATLTDKLYSVPRCQSLRIHRPESAGRNRPSLCGSPHEGDRTEPETVRRETGRKETGYLRGRSAPSGFRGFSTFIVPPL